MGCWGSYSVLFIITFLAIFVYRDVQYMGSGGVAAHRAFVFVVGLD